MYQLVVQVTTHKWPILLAWPSCAIKTAYNFKVVDILICLVRSSTCHIAIISKIKYVTNLHTV